MREPNWLIERHADVLRMNEAYVKDVKNLVNNQNFQNDYPELTKFYVEKILQKRVI